MQMNETNDGVVYMQHCYYTRNGNNTPVLDWTAAIYHAVIASLQALDKVFDAGNNEAEAHNFWMHTTSNIYRHELCGFHVDRRFLEIDSAVLEDKEIESLVMRLVEAVHGFEDARVMCDWYEVGILQEARMQKFIQKAKGCFLDAKTLMQFASLKEGGGAVNFAMVNCKIF